MNKSQTTPRRSCVEAHGLSPSQEAEPLRFGDVALSWLSGPVRGLRPTPQSNYRNWVVNHLNPRFADRQLDSITVDEIALLIRELRDSSLGEWSISGVLGTFNRVYRFAGRRLDWRGRNPADLLMPSESPLISAAPRRPIFEGEQLAQTIAAAHAPDRAPLLVGGVKGARGSE